MMRITLAAAMLGGFVLTQPAAAERVCRQDCVGPVCSEKCVESGPNVRIESDRDRTVGQGNREREGVVIERERRGREGVTIQERAGRRGNGPGVDIEIGR